MAYEPRPAVPRPDLPEVATEIAKAILAAGQILISSSARLDGDGIGSELAMLSICRHLGKNAVVVNDGPLPANLKFLPGVQQAYDYPKAMDAQFDLLVTVDCGSKKMLERVGEGLPEKCKIANIDHHAGSTQFGDWNWIDFEASSAGQLVYELAGLLKVPITKEMATCLYTAITTDTGGFSYNNTSARTMAVASHLLETGMDPSEVSRAVYRSRTPQFLALMGKVLGTFNYHADNRIVVARITQAARKQTGGDPKESLGLMELVTSVGSGEVSFLLKETEDGHVKCSLRSEGLVDVNAIANKFGGGGHLRASGCKIAGTLDEAEAKLVAEATAALNAAAS
ncbi:MAG: DHH family phosphoesterase [Planctomycetota bacterium]|jgi:phosphoesterase RecJ-like protein